MELQENQYVYIQSYKHDGSLHRTWAMGYVLEANEKRIVAVTNRTLVSESDGRKWVTREPAICFFYPDKWYNVICMIRKTGIHYYCNLASPSIYDGEAIKNIDYDLDVTDLTDRGITDWGKIKTEIKDSLGEFVWKKTKRRPMIIPIIMEV